MTMIVEEIATPIGTLTLAQAADALVHVAFDGAWNETPLAAIYGPASSPPSESEALKRVRAYFDGDLRAIDAIPVSPRGTAFRLAVWDAMRAIPPGEPVSYAELAARAGRPSATRAAGTACGANPIPVVVPCHRILRTGGGIGGYGGGLAAKRWLLAHEAANANVRG
ncbi:MAG TPA: methylated-DNA--[protein]-cysteine S-methyltransferase [Actinomycetota bacterium]|nr:methylated-DNA--[protein]-cysteine S-methyltransferase [Actinomycetota bacterium]